MRKLSIATAFFALVIASSGFAIYEAGGNPQHRKPAEPAQPAQPQQPAQPAQPKEGHAQPPDAPKTGQAVPRPPDARNEPDHSRRSPQRGPVAIPYPGWPWGYPYPYGYPPRAGWRVYADWEAANVRIDVSPKDAQVYVDAYYAGVVDDFDGIFQRLTLHPGPHLLEVRKTGYRSLVFELNLYPGQTVTYRRTMEPSSAGDAAAPAVASTPGFDEGAALPPAPGDVVVPGEVRFDVTPKDAEIYADGFYAGLVDDFNGAQRLQLAPGRHRVVLKLDGYTTVEVDLSIESGRSITYRATLPRDAKD